VVKSRPFQTNTKGQGAAPLTAEARPNTNGKGNN
jgi:hypothetical protein